MHPKVVSARRIRATQTCVEQMGKLIEILGVKTEAPEMLTISGKQARHPDLPDVIRLEAVAQFLVDLEAKVEADEAEPEKAVPPAKKSTGRKSK